ncbi:zinc finger protein CONSTANS-LIKE 16-like [Telopea speciosissima]|uniref:zinc finger protein CONSTANS-LIKE 16-like n=1 Tax=Telopea speciosissima TaxID=54955 RepID=UPI001CC774BF|nr:zinc finger protein CONSTANS-LIKE 16-like [Telopea speciosissima]
MTSDCKIASAVGGKTARACDSCLLKRARWYCAADDAFLCQICDGSVHSANPLARRHERVRLKTSSSLKPTIENSLPSWHQGFTRKARTTRHGKSTRKLPKIEEPILLNPLPLVPEMGSDEASPNENEEQLLYRVPIFDPLVAELCTSSISNEGTETTTTTSAMTAALERESKILLPLDVENLPGFLPSDMDLEEFAADVESLLGRGLDEDTFGMEGLGLLGAKEEDTTMETMECGFGDGKVKVEEEEGDDVDGVIGCHVDLEVEMGRETLDLNFDCDSPTTAEEEEEEKVGGGGGGVATHDAGSAMMVKINGGYKLKLDYEAVITAWAGQGPAWTTGDRFQLNPDDWWPDYSTTCSMGVPYGDMRGGGAIGDGGREARVSRYREKRRTRLFSKKIRYEVRKLNAEKRPRMKGRFVKRASFGGSGFPF